MAATLHAHLLASSEPSMMTWPPVRLSRWYSSAYQDDGLSDTKLVLSAALPSPALQTQPPQQQHGGLHRQSACCCSAVARGRPRSWCSPAGAGQVLERGSHNLLHLALRGLQAAAAARRRCTAAVAAGGSPAAAAVLLSLPPPTWWMSMQGLNLTHCCCWPEQDTCSAAWRPGAARIVARGGPC